MLYVGQPLLGVGIGVVSQLPRGEFQLRQPPLHDVEFVGDAVHFHRQLARRLVDQVDRLVGQEAVGDVAVRELCGGDERRIADLARRDAFRTAA